MSEMLASGEMDRAMAADPDFRHGKVLPVKRAECKMSAFERAGDSLLWVNLTNDTEPAPWALLLNSLEATELNASVPHWLDVRDEIVRKLRDQRQSVNLVVHGQPNWRALRDHLQQDWLPRESVQSHRRITWMFAGSHHFSELPNVRWSSYLVSLRTLEVPPFTPEETRLLLSQPLKHARRETARAATSVFGSGFWGEDGMDRIHAEAGGWPHLVQLIASTIVDLCNAQGKDRAEAGILDEAMAKAVVSGDSVLAELMLYRSDEYPAAWSYLSAFRKQDAQPPPEDDTLRLTLKRHLLVQETCDGQWSLRVPLMRRWLRERT